MRTFVATAFILALARPASAEPVPNLIQNPRFDQNLAGWTASPGPGIPSWSSEDAYGSLASGSAIVAASAGALATLSQCVPVQPAASYDLGASLVWRTTGNGFAFLALTFYSDAACSGAFLSEAQLFPPGTSGGWTPLGVAAASPPGSQSALIRLYASTNFMPGRPFPDAYGDWDNLYFRLTAPAPPALSFHTLPPCRLLDTRGADGPTGGQGLPGSSDRLFVVAGSCGVPSTAAAAALNVTVTEPTGFGDLRVYVRDTPLPFASAINYGPAQTRANGAVVRLGSEGELVVRCDQSSGSVHLILDVTGYFE